jgi:hypothetical protein
VKPVSGFTTETDGDRMCWALRSFFTRYHFLALLLHAFARFWKKNTKTAILPFVYQFFLISFSIYFYNLLNSMGPNLDCVVLMNNNASFAAQGDASYATAVASK